MTLGLIPSGPAGIAATLKIMAKLARQFKKDVGIRELAGNLVRNLPQYDNSGSVRALHAFVRDSIRYTGDIKGVETIQTPKATLELGVGDCDDKSLLLASLLQAIGMPARFIAIAMNDGPYTHVLVETQLGRGGRWVPLETIRPVDVGWFPPNVTKKMIAHV
jgi:transglutaminase-like putative cysteine protease